jgi:putative oxidoreductase
MSLGILLLRVVVGGTLAAHGAQKLFGWFGGAGLDGTGRGFEALGFHPGKKHARNAGLAEVAGGLLLIVGLFTPLAAALILSVMFVAAATVHFRNGFFATTGGFEYNLVLAVAGLTAAFTGPGAISLDYLLGSDLSGVWAGLGAVAVGIIGGATQLAQRRAQPASQAVAA